MSRAFVKEDDAGQPPIIPPRPALPPGTPNYVRPRGLEQLRAEQASLEEQRARVSQDHEDEASRTRELTILNAQLNQLSQRIASAKVIDPAEQPSKEVRFGATVKLRTRSGGKPGMERKFTIVGVDEADIKENKIAFVAPIARAVSGATLGDRLPLRMGRLEEVVEVAEISYEK